MQRASLGKRTCSTEFAIYGLGPVEIAISYFHEFKEVFEEILGFHVVAQEGNRYLLEVGGNGAQVILVDDDTAHKRNKDMVKYITLHSA